MTAGPQNNPKTFDTMPIKSLEKWSAGQLSFGKRLDVDLTLGRLQVITFSPHTARKWIGGRALNVAMLYDQTSHRIDPLGPENILLFSCGLLTGTAAPSASRLHVNAVSPLTGLLGSSNVGGYVGAWLRIWGYQSICIQGRSKTPVFLEFAKSGIHLRDAGTLWGLNSWQAHLQLTRLVGNDKIQSLVIGPAGENGNLFACIVTDGDHVAGRTGMGAVMGAKRLKAIVVHKPDRSCGRAVSNRAHRAVSDYAAKILASPDFKTFSRLGGAGYVQWANRNGLIGAHNYRRMHFKDAAEIDGRQLEARRARARGCARCPVQCKALLAFSRGRLKERPVFRPEFEPMLNLGAKCGLKDIEAVVFLDNLCTRLGLDSTSAATAIAFIMDLSQRGIIGKTQTTGMDLSWGKAATMETLIRQMASMEGLGALLGRGVRQAARQFGLPAEKYAAQVKGLELTAYHPAALLGSALGYAISSRGGDYNNIYASLEHRWSPEQAAEAFGTAKALDPHSYEGKGRLVCRAALVNIMLDSLGICKVPALSLIGAFDLKDEAHLTAGLTGWDLNADELFQRAQITADAERQINFTLGATAHDDDLPEMFFSAKGPVLDRRKFRQMVAEFYVAMGWGPDGRLLPHNVQRIQAAITAIR